MFVCSGNTCRSPMAATIMDNLKKDKDVVVFSRGMVVLFPEPYNPKAVAVTASHDMIMPNRAAAQLTEDDFDNDTLVLTMSELHKQKIYAEYSNAINVYTLNEYIGDTEGEVKDPYGKGNEEYVKCFDRLYEMIKKAADMIFADEQTEKGEA